MKSSSALFAALGVACLALPACQHKEGGETEKEATHTIVMTSPKVKDVTVMQQYVCLIRAQKVIEVHALQEGYLEEVHLKEGQSVKEGEVLFRVLPTLYKARLDRELQKVRKAEYELQFTQKLANGPNPVVSASEVLLKEVELATAKTEAAVAQAEFDFTIVKAPFDGVIDRFGQFKGSVVKKEEILTTLTDNRVMWVYFNVPEARYLDYKAAQGTSLNASQLKLPDTRVELVLADGRPFNQSPGDTVTIEGKFNNETGNIPFRADFPNPNGLLKHGQTGALRLHRAVHNALVIPQRATFEVLDKQYVWVVGDDKVAHRRLITVAHELEDQFVIASGLSVNDKFVLEGVGQVKENDKIHESEFEKPEVALDRDKVKFYAE